jgi:hypothetical protein
MEKEGGKLFWFKKRKGEKDLLIFWPGYRLGNVHIYEFKESIPAVEMDKLMREHNRECWIYGVGTPNVVYSAGEWELLQRQK